MTSNRVFPFVLLIVLVFGIAVLAVFSLQDFLSSPNQSAEDFVQSFSSVALTILGAVFGVLISDHFFYKQKIKDLNDKYFSKCACIDSLLTELQDLNDTRVNSLLYENEHITSSTELFLYNSKFIEFAELLSHSPRSERTRLLNELKTKIMPVRRYTEDRACEITGCPGVLNLDMHKGQHFKIKCSECCARYSAYVSKNDKLVMRRIPEGYKRLTYTHFDEDLEEYLRRIRAYIPKEDLALIAKAIVRLSKSKKGISFTGLKRRISKDKELNDKLADIDDANHVLSFILSSKSFFISPEDGSFPGYSKPINIEPTEQDVYVSLLKYLAYKIKEDRQLVVDRKIVKKLISMILPKNAFGVEIIENNRATKNVLDHIYSADKYENWETDVG